jgi:O-antigen ligase
MKEGYPQTMAHIPGTISLYPRAPQGAPGGLLQAGERLGRGIWPRSLALWMAAFYLALFIIRPWEKLFPWLATFRFERLYALAMIGVVILTRGPSFRLDRQTVAVLAFFGCISVSGLFAWDPALSAGPVYQYATLVIFFVILTKVIRSPYELVFTVTCYIVTMSAYLAKSQWEFFVHGVHRYRQGVPRLVGVDTMLGGPNYVAMSVVVSLPMLLFLYQVREEFSARWPAAWRKGFRWGLAVYLVLALTSIVLTNSRSGMLSTVLFLALVAMHKKRLGRKVSYALGAVVLLGCAWLLMPETSKNRLRTIWDPSAGPRNATVSAMGRLEGLRAGMVAWQRFPLTGVGVGNLLEYRDRHIDGIRLQAHNIPGQLLGETGLLGAAGFLLLVGAILANCRRIRAMAKGRTAAAPDVLSRFAVAAQMSVLLLLFEGLFFHNIYRFNWVWLAAFCALALRFVRRPDVRAGENGLERSPQTMPHLV